MKPIYAVLLLITFASFGIGIALYMTRDRVEQESDATLPNANKINCGCEICISTYVWYDDKIVKSWYDNPDSTSNIILHKLQADSLLKHIKQY